MKNKLKHAGLIGSGHFCNVSKYLDEESNIYYAYKELKKEHSANDDYKIRLKKEIEIKDLNDLKLIKIEV